MTSASTPEDTIRVQQRLADVDISDSDSQMEKNDAVEEYDFSNELDDGGDEDDDGLDTAHYKYPNGVITISSDDEGEIQATENWQPSDRPWRAEGFNETTRHSYETMYSDMPQRPMADVNGIEDWDITEEYMRERDNEMLQYIEDHPLPEWLISPTKAQDAYSRLLERVRWRSLGTRIYCTNSMPGYAQMSAQPFQSMAMQMPNAMRHFSQGMPSPRSASGPYAQGFQQMQPPPMPQGITNGRPTHAPHTMAPPPTAIVPSQPNIQPMQPYPNGMPVTDPTHSNGQRPHVASVQVSQPSPTYTSHAHHATPNVPSSKGRKARERKTYTPPVEVAASATPPTPPYETRPKPAERKTLNKLANRTSRRHQRRHAEAEIFPWNRSIDFKTARESAVWDDSIYDQVTLADMEAVRAQNVPIIERIDGDEIERQRMSRVAKKAQTQIAEGSSDAEKPKRRSKAKSKGDSSTSDQQHAGSYNFATKEDEQRASKISKETANDIMLAYEVGGISLDVCADIKICWNAGKKGNMQELKQVCFSIKDSIITREQMDNTPILTHKAAERMVDFCPDLLWRDMLLRIASEAGFGNKEIRDRMCHNGNYVDKATITKRIGAALGQKQHQAPAKDKKKSTGETSDAAQAKINGYLKGEDDYYNSNVTDFANYMDFFGYRTSHRNQLEGGKRKRKLASGEYGDSSGMEEVVSSPRKRRKGAAVSMQSPDVIVSSDDTTGMEGGDESEDESEAAGLNADAVSIQSDTMLDEMDDD